VPTRWEDTLKVADSLVTNQVRPMTCYGDDPGQLHMNHRRFELLLSGLAARDGRDVVRWHGGPDDGGFIATTSARWSFSKHTKRAKPVGVSDFHKLKGIAGPAHDTDVAILITNGTFSKHDTPYVSGC
jgi:hypothetical protein